MAIVHLIDFTGKGTENESRYAAEKLAFTKATRLEMSPDLMSEIRAWRYDKLEEEIRYMANTIASSWEFVHVTFLIEGVTRPTAQQITRTRNASYAMQSQRVVDASEIPVHNPFQPSQQHVIFDAAVECSQRAYEGLLLMGSKKEDARGVLPQNVTTNLVAEYNLRSFVDLMLARGSLRTQGEYAQIANQMKILVINIWPWSIPFFETRFDRAIEILEKVAKDIGLEVGSGTAWDIAKAIDLLRKA